MGAVLDYPLITPLHTYWTDRTRGQFFVFLDQFLFTCRLEGRQFREGCVQDGKKVKSGEESLSDAHPASDD